MVSSLLAPKGLCIGDCQFVYLIMDRLANQSGQKSWKLLKYEKVCDPRGRWDLYLNKSAMGSKC